MPLLETVVMESDSAFATSFAGVFVTHSAALLCSINQELPK